MGLLSRLSPAGAVTGVRPGPGACRRPARPVHPLMSRPISAVMAGTTPADEVSTQTEPTWTEPSRTGPSRAEPGRAKPGLEDVIGR